MFLQITPRLKFISSARKAAQKTDGSQMKMSQGPDCMAWLGTCPLTSGLKRSKTCPRTRSLPPRRPPPPSARVASRGAVPESRPAGLPTVAVRRAAQCRLTSCLLGHSPWGLLSPYLLLRVCFLADTQCVGTARPSGPEALQTPGWRGSGAECPAGPTAGFTDALPPTRHAAWGRWVSISSSMKWFGTTR